jgi:biopolymer transport protein ExbD
MAGGPLGKEEPVMGAKLGGGGGGKKGGHSLSTEPNVIPFIDILLVLLIIFMVAAPAPTVDVNIDLPPPTPPENQTPDSAKPVFLFIDANGNLAINDVGIRNDQIQEELYKAIRTVNPNTPNPFDERVFVRGAFSLPFREVMKVMDQVMSAGYYKVGLVTEDVDAPAQ